MDATLKASELVVLVPVPHAEVDKDEPQSVDNEGVDDHQDDSVLLALGYEELPGGTPMR